MIRSTFKNIISKSSLIQQANQFHFTKKKEGFQIIDYNDLLHGGSDLNLKFQRGYGKDGIGSVIVRNIPNLQEARYKLVPFTQQLANLPDDQLEKLSKPENHNLRGWSQRNQQVYGVQDKNLGIFRAHLLKDDKYQKSVSQVENLPKRILNLVGDNVWPDENPQLKNKYKKLFLDYHSIVQKTAIILLGKLEKYIEFSQPYFRTSTVSQLLKRSDQHIGSSYYSYPNCNYEQLSKDWEYWSSDYTLLQGKIGNILLNQLFINVYFNRSFFQILNTENHSSFYFVFNSRNIFTRRLSSQIYINQQGEMQDYVDPDSGLHIFSSDPNSYIKIRIDDNSILFKAGESLQIISGGVIYPKPHRLIRGNFLVGKNLSIDYLNTVIQPNVEEKLSVPAGVKVDEVLDKEIQNIIPPLSERWQQGKTYGEFVEKTLQTYSTRK